MAPRVCSVEVGPEPPKGEGRIRRHWKVQDKLLTVPEEGINTLYDVVQRSSRLFSGQNALGWRDTIKVHNEEKEITKTVKGKEVKETKKWTFYELSDYHYLTYAQFVESVKDIASGLVELGITKDNRFNVYSSTRPTWQLLAHACISQSITFATSYDSLGEEGLQHSLDEPEVVGIFTNAGLLGTLAAVIDKTPTVKYVIYDDKLENDKAVEKIKAANGGIRILHLDELKKLGKEKPHDANPPKSTDIACIMYTSGSTGKPKGVLLSHANIVSAIAAAMITLGDLLLPGESYIAFLPLAHILEFTVEMIMLYIGIPIGYGNIKTLTETSVRNCLGDIRTYRPTVMAGVPAVWELIRKGILTKVHAGGPVKEKLFHGAVALKKRSRFLFGGVTDAVVFKQVKTATGGRLRYAINGGAALSRETQEFLEIAVVQVLGGYGLTESCAMASVTHPDFYSHGVVGAIMPANEVKLVDFKDAGYFSTNNPPQGEVYVRGNSITKGYFKRDDATKENLNDDGWLMTGDIGQWNADGTLSIIDRKKNLVKLAGGEYIAVERLESVYKGCSVVGNLCVIVDPNANKPAAIVFPHEANLKNFVADKGIGSKDSDLSSLTEDDKVRDAVLAEMNAVGKRQGFKALELLQTVILTDKEWTPQNGMLTAAQKLSRKKIEEFYKEEIKANYTPS